MKKERDYDNLKATGVVILKHFDEAGNLLNEVTTTNMVVTSGLNWMAKRITGQSTDNATHMALGGNGTNLGLTNTIADLSEFPGRSGLNRTNGEASDNRITFSTTFQPGFGTSSGTGVVTAGIVTAETGGNLIARTIFPSIAKQANDSLAVTWIITLS